ncbi:hypothetical protein [Collimonas fungivorans]
MEATPEVEGDPYFAGGAAGTKTILESIAGIGVASFQENSGLKYEILFNG